MRFYYGASIWGAEGDPNFNLNIISHLKTRGEVLSEILFTPDYAKQSNSDVQTIHNRDLAWVRESDKMIMEVSAPSLGVGYEIREGVVLSKPILCLWRRHPQKKLSAMIAGSPQIRVCEYSNLEEAKRGIDFFLGNA